MRILYVSAYPPAVDGIGDYTAALAGAVRDDGHEVRVVTARPLDGAPDEVLSMCTRVDLADRVAPLDDEIQTRFADRNAQMADRAMRVLALAHRSLPAE